MVFISLAMKTANFPNFHFRSHSLTDYGIQNITLGPIALIILHYLPFLYCTSLNRLISAERIHSSTQDQKKLRISPQMSRTHHSTGGLITLPILGHFEKCNFYQKIDCVMLEFHWPCMANPKGPTCHSTSLWTDINVCVCTCFTHVRVCVCVGGLCRCV